MFATKFSKETCDCGLMFSPSPLWRASEGRRPESESKQNVCEPPWGEAFEYIRCRFSAPSLPLARAPPGAKPSSTPAVVFRPPSLPLRKPHGGRSLRVRPLSFFAPLLPGEQNRICSSGILWMFFGFVWYPLQNRIQTDTPEFCIKIVLEGIYRFSGISIS